MIFLCILLYSLYNQMNYCLFNLDIHNYIQQPNPSKMNYVEKNQSYLIKWVRQHAEEAANRMEINFEGIEPVH